MYKAYDIAKVFEIIAPIQSGLPGDELGFIYGDPETQISGIACLWNIHVPSLMRCIDQNLNMIICHEGLWFPEQISDWYKGPSKEEIFSNRARKQLLDRHRLVVYRSHSNWDALENNGVPDQAIQSLNIKELHTVARQKFFSVQELPRPYSITELKDKVKSGLHFSFCRIFGNPKKLIRRFAFLIGGFGENQQHMPQAARDMGAELIIIGEMSEFIVIACLEMGMPVIETLHSASEIPAIKRQAAMLSKHFLDLSVCYVPSGALAFMDIVHSDGSSAK